MTSERDQIAALLVQRDQMLQIIGALVERTGAEVTILPSELLIDRRVTCDPVGLAGALRVQVKHS